MQRANVTEIFYNRVADYIRNQPDAARSHAFDKQRMDELIQALDGWDDLDAQERSRRNPCHQRVGAASSAQSGCATHHL